MSHKTKARRMGRQARRAICEDVRFAEVEFERPAKLKLAAAEAEIARKDQIIAALMQRLYGSKSERLDPNQIDLDFDEATLGKPERENGGGECGPEAAEDDEAKPKRKRRRKVDLFPKKLPVVIDRVDIPAEVAADPDAFTVIGEEHHDELDITRAAAFWRRIIRKKFVSKSNR